MLTCMFKLLLQHNYPNSKIQTNSIWYSWKRIAKCFFKIRRKGNQEYNFMISGSSKARLGYMCPVDGLRQPRPPPRGNCPGRRPQAPACFKYSVKFHSKFNHLAPYILDFLFQNLLEVPCPPATGSSSCLDNPTFDPWKLMGHGFI